MTTPRPRMRIVAHQPDRPTNAAALIRAAIVVLENYQRVYGLVDVPEALRPYPGKNEIGEVCSG